MSKRLDRAAADEAKIEKIEGKKMMKPAVDEPVHEEGLSASVQVLPLPAGLYLFSVKAGAPRAERSAGQLNLPAMHVGLGPGVRADQVEFVAGPGTDGHLAVRARRRAGRQSQRRRRHPDTDLGALLDRGSPVDRGGTPRISRTNRGTHRIRRICPSNWPLHLRKPPRHQQLRPLHPRANRSPCRFRSKPTSVRGAM